jgi:hypothetical protein
MLVGVKGYFMLGSTGGLNLENVVKQLEIHLKSADEMPIPNRIFL